MKNRFIFRSRISERKFKEILNLFCLDIEASKVSQITGVSRPTINKIFDRIRGAIARDCEQISPFATGEVEVNGSGLGAKRARGPRGGGAKGRIPVFGMRKHHGKIYTQVVKNCTIAEILPIMETYPERNALIPLDGLSPYDGLADFGHKKFCRIKHGNHAPANGHNPIDGIENFWGLCKVRLTRFRGIHKHKFYLHLKECEFRYNMSNENMYIYLIELIRNSPLKLS